MVLKGVNSIVNAVITVFSSQWSWRSQNVTFCNGLERIQFVHADNGLERSKFEEFLCLPTAAHILHFSTPAHNLCFPITAIFCAFPQSTRSHHCHILRFPIICTFPPLPWLVISCFCTFPPLPYSALSHNTHILHFPTTAMISNLLFLCFPTTATCPWPLCMINQWSSGALVILSGVLEVIKWMMLLLHAHM